MFCSVDLIHRPFRSSIAMVMETADHLHQTGDATKHMSAHTACTLKLPAI